VDYHSGVSGGYRILRRIHIDLALFATNILGTKQQRIMAPPHPRLSSTPCTLYRNSDTFHLGSCFNSLGFVEAAPSSILFTLCRPVVCTSDVVDGSAGEAAAAEMGVGSGRSAAMKGPSSWKTDIRTQRDDCARGNGRKNEDNDKRPGMRGRKWRQTPVHWSHVRFRRTIDVHAGVVTEESAA